MVNENYINSYLKIYRTGEKKVKGKDHYPESGLEKRDLANILKIKMKRVSREESNLKSQLANF